jgi:N-acetyl-anhydromuramoyl-L-alanine amidase
MQFDAEGWFSRARQCRSPHQDERPQPEDISLLVIHGISLPPGQFGGPFIEQLFLGQLDHSAHPYFAGLMGLRVSSHFLIRRDGEVVQFVSARQRAWHAGVSQFAGRERCNDFSLGIELEGDDVTPYDAAQYTALTTLTLCIQLQWPAIRAERIVGHEHIAPGRKTDPGPSFDWLRYRAALAVAASQ